MQFDASLTGPVLRDSLVLGRDAAGKLLPALSVAAGADLAFTVWAETHADSMWLPNFTVMMIGLVVQIWTISVALHWLGVRSEPLGKWRLGAFWGLSIITTLGALLGMLLLILPGLYLAGRWFVAAPAMLHEDISITEAMGRSRDLLERFWLSGTLLSLIASAVMIVAVVIELAATPERVSSSSPSYWIVSALGTVISRAGSMFWTIASTVLYARLAGDGTREQEIFG